MDKPNNFCWRQRARSFRYAFQGLAVLLREEHNARLHLFFALLAIGLGIALSITRFEWLAIILCIALVFSAEAMNTALESLCNLVSPEHHELIKKSKDCAAAAVFLVALSSALIGTIIFLPKLLKLVTGG